MSISRLTKILIYSALLLLPGPILRAATATFDGQKFDMPVSFSTPMDGPFIRNDFNLFKLAQATTLGNSLTDRQVLLTDQTIAGIEQAVIAVNKPAAEAKLTVEDNRATEFNPGQTGEVVDVYALRNLLITQAPTIELPIVFSLPQTTLSQTNSLGINELVATGESNFKGSPKNRIHNIDVGADKFNGVIIAPGEEFSFNQYLGDVDQAHGFLPELVIKATGVAPEYGGGLCQVSSTTFRAAMNAGLPITARRNHSFAVSYYSPQGTDATIYPGSADLKFINNFSSPILIRTRIDGTKLYFDFFGTKDDRSVAFEGPVQYDRKPDGSMKATWTRHVTQNGQTTTQVFNSVYLPPSLFEPAPKTETPPSAPVPVAITN